MQTQINKAPQETSLYTREVKRIAQGERRKVYLALYVAPLCRTDEDAPIDPASRFQVRNLTVYQDGGRDDMQVTEFVDKILAIAYCEHAAGLRESLPHHS